MKQRYREFEVESIDDNNYQLSRVGIVQSGKNAGNETLSLVGYFNSIESVVNRIATLSGNKADDLRGWLDEYRNVKDEIRMLT